MVQLLSGSPGPGGGRGGPEQSAWVSVQGLVGSRRLINLFPSTTLQPCPVVTSIPGHPLRPPPLSVSVRMAPLKLIESHVVVTELSVSRTATKHDLVGPGEIGRASCRERV